LAGYRSSIPLGVSRRASKEASTWPSGAEGPGTEGPGESKAPPRPPSQGGAPCRPRATGGWRPPAGCGAPGSPAPAPPPGRRGRAFLPPLPSGDDPGTTAPGSRPRTPRIRSPGGGGVAVPFLHMKGDGSGKFITSGAMRRWATEADVLRPQCPATRSPSSRLGPGQAAFVSPVRGGGTLPSRIDPGVKNILVVGK